MKQLVAIFQSTRAVIQAQRLCTKHEIRCTIIPVPRSISSECAMAIEIDVNDRETVQRICEQEGIAMEFVVWEKGG